MSDKSSILETLPTLNRLAMAYCPAASRSQTLAFLAFDARLAAVVRSASEPMLAQVRLAWWRELLARPPRDWPRGEPLLVALECWTSEAAALAGLVDGWEAMVVEVPDIASLATARASAFGALARLVGEADHAMEAERAGRGWALADIASRLSDRAESGHAHEMLRDEARERVRLPRSLRTLAVLHGLARRCAVRGTKLEDGSPGALFAAMRIGLAGV